MLEIVKLEIEPLIPLIQTIMVDGANFKLNFYWREYDDSVMVDLLDEENNILIKGDTVRLNIPLFTKFIPDGNLNIPQNFPQKLIVPLADTEYVRVGINTLFVVVHLYLIDREYMSMKRGESVV